MRFYWNFKFPRLKLQFGWCESLYMSCQLAALVHNFLHSSPINQHRNLQVEKKIVAIIFLILCFSRVLISISLFSAIIAFVNLCLIMTDVFLSKWLFIPSLKVCWNEIVILSPHCMRLYSSTLKALMCTQNWMWAQLKGIKFSSLLYFI